MNRAEKRGRPYIKLIVGHTSRRRRRRLNRPLVGWLPTIVRVVTACVAVALLLATLAFASPSASAATADTLYLQGQAKAQVDALHAQAATVQAGIDALDQQIEQLNESYNQLSLQVDTINTQMADLRRQLGLAQADHDYRVRALNERLVSIYKAGGREQFLEMLLSSHGIMDLVNRIRVVATLAGQDNRLVSNLHNSTGQLDTILKEIDSQKQAEVSARRQMDEKLQESQAALAERQSTLEGLDKQVSDIIEQERQRQIAEQERLRAQLLATIANWKPYTGPIPQNDNAVLNQVVQTAATYLGIPYVWAGDRPSTGFDCSGFTRYVLAQHGVDLPHYSGYQAEMGVPVDLKDIQAGDLVAFGSPVYHVGLYIGDGEFMQAPHTGDVVKISVLSERTDLSAIRRFPLQPRAGPPAVN